MARVTIRFRAGRDLSLVELLVALCVCGSASLSAQTNSYISLGQYKAHPTRILAKYKNKNADAVSVQSTKIALRALGVVVKEHLDLVPGLVVLDSDPELARQSARALNPQGQAANLVDRIAALENTGLFEYVQPSYVYTNLLVPNDASFTDDTLWGLSNTGQNGGVVGADIDAVRAWDITTGSTNVIVAVIDSGIRYTHRDLAAQMWHNPGENPINGLDDDGNGIVDDVFGINAVALTGDPMDDNGHGTHVSGTLGAAANDGNPMVGVAWQVQLMACKFLDSTGVGLTDDAIRCIAYAVKKGARILNNSWGGGPFEPALFDAISAAQKQNVLFVAAAGNNAEDNDEIPVYPASYQLDNIISVAAIDRADNLASFSNYGARTVHVAAPGVDIFSTWAGSDTDYQVQSGTSMAAPYVSGVAALVLAKYPQVPLVEWRQRIIATADRVPGLRGRLLSEGRVNAYRALTETGGGVMAMAVYPPGGNSLLVGSQVDIFVTVTALAPVTNATVIATYIAGATTNTLQFLDDGNPPDVVSGDATYSATLTVPNLPGDLELDFNVTAPAKTNLTDQVVYHLVDHPSNDNFEEAFKVPAAGGLLLGDNRFATIQGYEPKHAHVPSVAASVWWNWSPAANGNVIVDTAGSSFDTVLAVYANNTLRTLHEIASVDNVGRNNSRKQGYVQFDAIAGITYRIAVAGYDSQEVGSIRLRVEPGGQPDVYAPVAVITSPTSGSIITNTEPRIAVAGTAVDLVPNASGVKEVFVQINDGLAVRAYGATNWSSTNLVSLGLNAIRVVAADYAGNRSEPAVISIRYIPVAVPNDLFVNALQLTNTSGSVSGYSTNATKEVGEPFHAGNEGGHSLWWVFLAPSDGVLTLSTINSDFDTLLAVYTGDRVNNLTLAGSNDDATPGSRFSLLEQGLLANQVYHIAVDGYDGDSGHVVLDYTFVPTTVVHIDVQTPDGGTVTPGSGLYPGNTNLVFTAIPGPNQDFDHWDGSVSSTDNPLTVNATGDMQLIVHFVAHQPSEGFESGNLTSLPWTTAGNAPWFVESSVVAAGKFAARSGAITDGQSSSLILQDIGVPAGTASFDFKVSSELNWDFLEFYLNGKRLARWSGEVGWLTFQFDVPAGANTLEWRYTKDPVNGSVGLDAAFIDNLELPKATGAPTIQVQRLEDGRVQLTVQGPAVQTYTIQASNDLVTWTSLPQAEALGSGATFLDSTTTGQQTRFYRMVLE